MAETWYMAYEFGGGAPKPVEIESHTAKFVTLVGSKRRDAIDSDWRVFRPTYAEAREWIIARRLEALANAEERVAYARKWYLEAEAIPAEPQK